MKGRWGQAAATLMCVGALTIAALGMSSTLGGRLALAIARPGIHSGGSVSLEAFVTLLMPNYVSNSANPSIFSGTFWESFFDRPPSTDAILETLVQDEEFTPLTGEGLYSVVYTDLHPDESDGYPCWNGGYIRNKSIKDFDVTSLMEQPLDLGNKSDGPQVLIFHTHSRESYNDTGEVFAAPEVTHNNDTSKSVVAVGDVLKQTLEAQGISVIHSTDIYDSTYTGAYSRSDAAVAAILEQYPSIRVVMDLHRDAVYTGDGGKYRPVVEKDGMKVAQIMILAGTGNDSDDVNPHWQDNIRFGLTLQSEVEKVCPGISRAMMVRTSTYNQNRSKGAILIEVGTTGNTLTEAKRSAYFIGQALGQILA